MVLPLEVLYRASLGSASSDEDVDLAIEPIERAGIAPARVRVFRNQEAVTVEVSFDVASVAGTMESNSEWRRLADDLRPIARSLAMEASVAVWRPLRGLECVVQLSDGAEWNPYSYYDLTAAIDAGPARLRTDGLDNDLGKRPFDESVTGSILAQAPAVEDPLAQYVCVWQALATLLDEDSPTKIDSFLQTCGEPLLDPVKAKDRPETRFTRLRQQIAHPVDREALFQEMCSDAVLLAPALGGVVLQAYRSGV